MKCSLFGIFRLWELKCFAPGVTNGTNWTKPRQASLNSNWDVPIYFEILAGKIWPLSVWYDRVYSVETKFTKHSIEFELVETNQLFGSNANVMLTQQTCGQRSGMAAVSKRRALAFYFPYESQSVADSVCCRPHLDVGIAERSTPVQIRWNCTFSFSCSREDDHLW